MNIVKCMCIHHIYKVTLQYVYIYMYMHTHLNMYTFSTYIHNSSIFPHPNKPCWRKTELHYFPPHFLWVSSMGWICKWLGAWSHHPNMVHWTLPCSSHFSSNSPAWLPNRQRKYALEHSRGKDFYVSGVLWIFHFSFSHLSTLWSGCSFQWYSRE